MAQIIMPLLETDELRSYIECNTDVMNWFDDDEKQPSEEEQAAIIDKVIASSTDGRLRDVLYDCFDTWAWEQFSEVMYSAIDEYVDEEITRLLNKED